MIRNIQISSHLRIDDNYPKCKMKYLLYVRVRIQRKWNSTTVWRRVTLGHSRFYWILNIKTEESRMSNKQILISSCKRTEKRSMWKAKLKRNILSLPLYTLFAFITKIIIPNLYFLHKIKFWSWKSISEPWFHNGSNSNFVPIYF